MKGIHKVPQASFRKVVSVRNSLTKKDCAANQSEYSQDLKKLSILGEEVVVGELLRHFMRNALQFGVALPQSNVQKMK